MKSKTIENTNTNNHGDNRGLQQVNMHQNQNETGTTNGQNVNNQPIPKIPPVNLHDMK